MERLASLSRWTLNAIRRVLQKNVWHTRGERKTSDAAVSQGPPADSRSWKRQEFSPRTPWGTEVRPCQHPNFSSVIVILDFWPLELWENKFFPPRGTKFVLICYSNPRKFIQVRYRWDTAGYSDKIAESYITRGEWFGVRIKSDL